METCKGKVLSGARKGQFCLSSIVDADGYCGKHQRYKEYVRRTSAGEKVCSQFFRGCDEVCNDSVTCKKCIVEKYGKGKIACAHDGCKNYAMEGNPYCGKHERDKYRDHEKTQGVRLCNIARGCFLECEKDAPCCKTCMVKHFVTNNKYFRPDINCSECIHCELPLSSDTISQSIKHCNACVELFVKSFHLHSANVAKDYKAFKVEHPEKHYEEIKKGANSRDLPFELALDYFTNLIKKDCYYCCRPLAVGIDRLDNSKGYALENAVPCCFPCNRMKHTLSTEEFINKCFAIYNHSYCKVSYGQKLQEMFPSFISKSNESHNEYSNKQGKKHEFLLTAAEYSELRKKECYLCGVLPSQHHKNGIDRKHNNIGYVTTNCYTCCGSCNLLKGNIPIGVVKSSIMGIVGNKALHQITKIKEMIPENGLTQIKLYVTEVIETSDALEKNAGPEPIEQPAPIPVPKQWKTRDIFDFLTAGQEHHYKAHCESNNEIKEDWPKMWSNFVAIKGQPWATAEPHIRAFVENLRHIRQRKLIQLQTQSRSASLLDREDRQVWPAETVAALFLAGRIGEFKTMTETFVGDDPKDPKWMKRWEEFVGTLEAQNNDKTALTKEIAKFMASQRAKKFRRSKT